MLDGGKSPMPGAARELLSGKLTGPNLRRIDIECDFEIETKETAKFEQEVNRVFQQSKEEEALLQLEAEDPQRRILVDSWTALAQNTAVRELSVDRFVPIWTSAFHSRDFRALLGRLESLHITLFGAKRGYRSINTIPAYVASLQSILKVLFLNSGSLNSLSLHASQHAPLGAHGHYHIPLSLKATHLPGLQHLSLKNCFIGFELAHFINAHANTLETLELHNCYSYRGTGDSAGAGGMSWGTFLSTITRPTMKLRRFVIADTHIPLTISDERLKTYVADTANEPEDVKNVRRAQMKNPNLRLFLYGFLRDYSGELWMNKEAILASFDGEDDQKAFDELNSLVRKNDEDAKGGEDVPATKAKLAPSVEVVELPV
ncbi:hypothetical protein N0V82_007518 [Gnomoniopsis sp. IMI 355080]|nr:hypothetical protein N0V82_007518 [Gnomoniopsis sp. IMI 355080]